MCGRFTQRFSWQEVRDLLDLSGPAVNLAPRYNLAPSQEAAVVRADGDGRTLSTIRWGLVPTWAKDARIGNRLINARSETAAGKPSFRSAFRRRRCIVPADGYYEWTRRDDVHQPWLIQPEDGGILAFAGLWERWTVPGPITVPRSLAHLKPGDELETFTVLTRAASPSVARIHHRMPVVLPPKALDAWLRAESVPLDDLPPPALTAHPVSLRVNSPAVDDRNCVEPLET